jgi:DUF4097 and DUF4098 domain-containing protein YvlB
MAYLRPRGSSIFSGLALIFIGALLLLRNFRGYDIAEFFRHWWPLILIVWGAIKLYERTAGGRSGDPGASRITAGEVFLVLGLLALVGGVVGWDLTKQKFPDIISGDSFPVDLDIAPKKVPPNSRITVRNPRGDVTVRASDDAEIHVSGKKNVKAWSESDAQRLGNPVSVEIVPAGDGYEIHPTGIRGGDSRIGVDMEVDVPAKSLLTIRSDHGDISVSDMGASVAVNSLNGDVEVRDTAGDVSIDMRHGDVKVSDAKGDVKISGKGGEVEVVTVAGGLTLNGEFYGPIRADKVAKGVRFVSQRTDLTLTQLSGHMEAGSGNLEIADAPGNLALRTNSYDVSIENAGGKVKVDNRNGNIEVRFSSPPREDIDITNSNSTISLSLPGSSTFDILADCHSGDIDSDFSADSLKKVSTESGDSHLEGKYGSGRGPKITLKTSYGSISLRKTSSDLMAPPAPPAPPAVRPPRAGRPAPAPKAPESDEE